MKKYSIARDGSEVVLHVCTEEGVDHVTGGATCYEVPPARSLKFKNHSPAGFEFGYSGSGPSQLALAILLDCFAKDDADQCGLDTALNNYQDFKEKFIATQSGRDGFEITEREIIAWLTKN